MGAAAGRCTKALVAAEYAKHAAKTSSPLTTSSTSSPTVHRLFLMLLR